MDLMKNKTQQDIENAPVTYKEFSEAMALVATKEQFEGLERKFGGLEGKFEGLEGKFEGLEGKFEGLRKEMRDEFEKVERRFGNIEANMATKQDISQLINILEKVLKKYSDYEIEETTHAKNHKDTNEKLEDHEKRITGLEAAPAGLA